jgi:hypothetical protein
MLKADGRLRITGKKMAVRTMLLEEEKRKRRMAKLHYLVR